MAPGRAVQTVDASLAPCGKKKGLPLPPRRMPEDGVREMEVWGIDANDLRDPGICGLNNRVTAT